MVSLGAYLETTCIREIVLDLGFETSGDSEGAMALWAGMESR